MRKARVKTRQATAHGAAARRLPPPDRAGLVVHAHDLVAHGIDSNGIYVLSRKILDESHSRTLILNK